MGQIANYFLPIFVGGILLLGLVRKVPVFETFVEGAREGLDTTARLVPTMVGLLTAVAMFQASGGLDVLIYGLKPIADFLHLPEQVMPLAILRPISGSGSLAILENIIRENGPDSMAGRVASVMMGSTETTFYAITAYFGAVGIKKTRHAIPAALTADIASMIVSAITVSLFFS
nr:nucleoside recognition domain-containing protein [uncultured Solibaculum sp.]